jgi:hypothetical protein
MVRVLLSEPYVDEEGRGILEGKSCAPPPGSQSAAHSLPLSAANQTAIRPRTGSANDSESGRDRNANWEGKARLTAVHPERAVTEKTNLWLVLADNPITEAKREEVLWMVPRVVQQL